MIGIVASIIMSDDAVKADIKIILATIAAIYPLTY